MSELETSPSSGAPTMCVNHPDLRAAFACAICSNPICNFCSVTREDGSRICSTCAPAQAVSAPLTLRRTAAPPPPLTQTLRCIQHPEVAAVHVCNNCQSPMCSLCDFVLPVNNHICPRCIASPAKGMTRGRKGRMIASYIIAGYNTVGLGAVLAGVFSSMLQTQADLQIFGYVFALLLSAPTLVGAALALSCVERRLRNPPSIWIAVIWNGLLLLVHLALTIIGNFK
jgi:hypothetical protein